MSTFFSNKTILVPFDFSDQAMSAVDEALSMADDTTTIQVVNIVVPTHALVLEAGMPIDLGDDRVRLEAAQEKLAERIAEKDKSIQTTALMGDPGHGIVDQANEIGADLILMPSHGRTGFSRLLLGSVAERVMRYAECPVMILRKPKG